MDNSDCYGDSAELAAMLSAAAALMAKGKSIEEIEMLAILFDMISDTLFAIALVEKKQAQIRYRREQERERRERGSERNE